MARKPVPEQQLKTISIQPRNVFGLRVDVKGNVNFTAKQEVLYPVAGVLSIHDFKTNKQKFLRFEDNSQPEIVSMSPNRKYFAVAERYEKCWINIYDMATLKKRKTLNFPDEIPTKSVESMSFTYDSKGIAVLSREPDAFLTIFYFDKSDTVVVGRVSNSGQRSLVAKHISCNLSDSGMVAVCGDYTFKLMSRQEKGFSLIGTTSAENRIFTSLAWLTAEILVIGTAKNELFFLEGGDPKMTFNAERTDVIDLTKVEDDAAKNSDDMDEENKKDVNCLTYFQKGFVYSVNNTLHVFEKESNYRFCKKTIITVPVGIYSPDLYRIANVAINQQMDTVLVTTLHNQIFMSMLVVPETLKVKLLDFQTLGEPLHIGGIVSMSVCSWKSIVMTAAKDQTIRIWNYETGKVELVKKYQVDVTAIALHPSGIFAAVGFNDQMRLMQILLDDLKLTKTFNFPRCKDADFSHQGHMLACGYDNLVAIVSVFSFETLHILRGHNGMVQSVRWSQSDTALVSSGAEGAVYEWNTATGVRANECVQKGSEYRAVALNPDMTATYAITHHGLLRELANSEITREIKVNHDAHVHQPLQCIALSRSGLVMFIGTERGQLYNVQVPLLDAGGGTITNFRFFDKAVTTMVITFNDLLLATGSEDGTIVFWTILNNEDRVAPMDPELGQCVDVMIPRADLLDKIATILMLEQRITQQIDEFQYQLRQGSAFHSEQMRDIHTGYCSAIADLKAKNEAMEAQHVDEFNILTENIAQTKDEHAKALIDMETDFHEKIIIEFNKSAKVKKQMDAMREDYEVKLRKSAGCLQDTIEALEMDFKKKLQERQELIRQLMKEMDAKKAEFVEFCSQVDVDNDRKMVETKLFYEKRLKDENDAMLKWRADAGVLEKKLSSVSRNCEELEKEKDVLRAEHYKTLGIIRGFQRDVDELKKECEDRDQTIREKEKRVGDLQKKNQELEKYKQVLNHKIVELKAQIEPREREIREKKDQIIDMEKELENLEKHNLQSELQLSELRDKYISCEHELRLERNRCRNSRTQVSRICGDIYHVSGYIQEPTELKTEVMKLYHRYSDDKSLKKSLELDAEVENEFLRQRDYLEKLLDGCRLKEKMHTDDSAARAKLIQENVLLLKELNKIRVELKVSQKHCFHMESILGISKKYLPTTVAREKLEKACANYEQMEQKHREEIMKLDEIIKRLRKENLSIREEQLANN